MNETDTLVALINTTTQIELAMRGDGLGFHFAFSPAGMQRCTRKILIGTVVYMPVVLKCFRLYVDNRDNAYFVVPCGCSSKPAQVELK